MNTHHKNLIVGAGLTGITIAERIASTLREPVTIIDRRPQLGGNAADVCYYDLDTQSIVYHQLYGAHIFHTANERVINYLSRFIDWHPYVHRVLASVHGGIQIPVPFSLRSLALLYPDELAKQLTTKLIATYGYGAKIPVIKLQAAEDEMLQNLGHYVYDTLFRGYTAKQWSSAADHLDSSVLARVPIVISWDDKYFDDPHQGIPRHGYSHLATKMLEHDLITVRLGTTWQSIRDTITYDRLFYTGPIDEYFNYQYGNLPYRSLTFKLTINPATARQPVAVINYPSKTTPYTRTIDYSHFLPDAAYSALYAHTTEYPCPYEPGKNEPYYPIPTAANSELYQKYRTLAGQYPSVYFAGRLGTYQYLNMDEAVFLALELVDGLL